jgi:hypothetical protein
MLPDYNVAIANATSEPEVQYYQALALYSVFIGLGNPDAQQRATSAWFQAKQAAAQLGWTFTLPQPTSN